MDKQELIENLNTLDDLLPFDAVDDDDTGAEFDVHELIYEASDVIESTIWVPVSERLPEADGEFAVAWLSKGERPSNKKCFIGYSEFVDGGWYSYSLNKRHPQGVDIFAWMPLPEQYVIKEDDL